MRSLMVTAPSPLMSPATTTYPEANTASAPSSSYVIFTKSPVHIGASGALAAPVASVTVSVPPLTPSDEVNAANAVPGATPETRPSALKA